MRRDYRPGSPEGSIESLLILVRDVVRFSRTQVQEGKGIKQVISRAGNILGVEYCSFFDLLPKTGKTVADEVYLWSARYGFIIGADCEDPDDGIIRIRNRLSAGETIFLFRNRSDGLIRKLFENREVDSALIIPVFSQARLAGSFVLWSRDPYRRWRSEELHCLSILAEFLGKLLEHGSVEERLLLSEEKFRTIVDTIGDFYFQTDTTGAIRAMSPSMVQALGYDAQTDLQGALFESLLADGEQWAVFLSDILQTNGVRDYELELAGKSGKPIYGSVSCRMVFDRVGRFQGLEGIIRDITRRKQYAELLEENQWKLDQAQKIAKLGVWSYYLNNRYLKVSPEIFSIFSIHTGENVIGFDRIQDMTAPQYLERLKSCIEQKIPAGEEFELEFMVTYERGAFKFIRMKSLPIIRDNIIKGAFGIFQDVTERKQVEQHLIRYAEELERKNLEMDALRTQLLDMNRELEDRVKRRALQVEELLRQKDEFIMQIGHDLKTPLTPLVAILPFIRKRIDDPEIGELLDMTIKDVTSIKHLITSVLELARMNTLYTVSDAQVIRVADVINEVITDYSYLILQKSLTVNNSVPRDLTTLMSPMHFETLIGNIIGNAVKYSYLEGTITISGEGYDDYILLQVRDTGIGMNKDDIRFIFDGFYRADSSRHERDSHGLGLTIAKRVIELYGGQIWAASEGEGKGTVFQVKLKKRPRNITTGSEDPDTNR